MIFICVEINPKSGSSPGGSVAAGKASVPLPSRVAAGPGRSGCSPSAQRGVHMAVSRVGRCQEWSEGARPPGVRRDRPGAEGANASARVNVPGSVPSVAVPSLASDLLPAVTDKQVPSWHRQLYRAGVPCPRPVPPPSHLLGRTVAPCGELTRSVLAKLPVQQLSEWPSLCSSLLLLTRQRYGSGGEAGSTAPVSAPDTLTR